MNQFVKKVLGVSFIGLGIGILMVLLLPITCWQILIGLSVIAIGCMWLKG